MKARRLLVLSLIPLAAAAGCEIQFTPDIEPLEIEQLPPQPFTDADSEMDPDTTIPGPLAPISPDDPSFDRNDPGMWIQAIEGRWPNIDMISCAGEFVPGCRQWTAEELGLVYQVLEDYLFASYLDHPIRLVRMEEDDDDVAGMTYPMSDSLGNPSGEIHITDRAWKSPPALGVLDAFDILRKKPEHFQGTLAHELTHLAGFFHPELIDWWIEQKEAFGLDLGLRDWRLGFGYDWSWYAEYKDNTQFYERRIQEEQFAMAVSGLMYEDSWR